MGEYVRGMRYFHICAMGTCKNAGYYQTKYGECYCKRCVIKYINVNGLEDFWPHGLKEIREIYNSYLNEYEANRTVEFIDYINEKKERETNRIVKKTGRKK